MVTLSPRDIDRFRSFIRKDEHSDCWLWGSYHYKGYGMLWAQGKNLRAHRVSYEQAKGPIPEGLVIDHLCRNPGCVNPDHLEPVTIGENVQRGIVGEVNRQRKLSQTHCKRGHEFTPENTRYTKAGTRCCRACIREVHIPKGIQKRSAQRAEARLAKAGAA